MARTRTLVLVLAGGQGGRLGLLTRSRAKPAVPYAGTHRLIDFPLSNCANAGLSDVWVSSQFNPISISDHLANGRPWDLDRNVGGLLVLQPRQGHDDRTGFHQGTADSLWRNAPLIREYDPETLVVVSADAVYRLDYSTVVEQHRDTGADVTMVTTEVAQEDAGRYGVVQVTDGRITDYAYKPEQPDGNLIANEVFAFSPGSLLDTLEDLASSAGEEGLADIGHEALPRLVREGTARQFAFDGYWRDVGTVEAYWGSHQDLVSAQPPFDLGDPAWPIRTPVTSQSSGARVCSSAELVDSLLTPGSEVSGRVERTVVGRGAVIEEGATVRDSVLLPGAVVRAGATVERAVLDEGVNVGIKATVGGHGDLTLVGLAAQIPEGAHIAAGASHPE